MIRRKKYSPGWENSFLLALVLSVGLGTRLLALQPFLLAPPVLDEAYYASVARGIAGGLGHTQGLAAAPEPAAFRPPLMAAALAGVMRTFGDHPAALRAFQIPLSLLVVAVVFQIAARRFGPQAAVFAGSICALSPSLVHYSHFLWSEGLTALWLALFLLAAEHHDRGGRDRPLLGAGLALGLAALTREIWLAFALPAAAWLLARQRGRWRPALRQAALLLAGLCLVVLPWTLRNQRVLGEWVPVSTNHWYPIAMGNLVAADDAEHRARQRALARAAPSSRAENERYWRRVALEEIRAQQPVWLARKLVATTAGLYNLRSQTLRFAQRGWVELGDASVRALVVAHVLGHGATLLLGIAGLWWVRGGALQGLAVLMLLHLQAVHTVANAGPRFLVPLLPVFALYAGPLLAGRVGRAEWRALPRWRRLGGLASLAAVVAIPLPRSLAFLAEVWPAGP